MKKIILYNFVSFILLNVIFTGCTGKFEEINSNPNNPEIVPATNVLGACFKVGAGPVFDTRMSCYYAGTFCGMVSAVDYEYRASINNSMWENIYIAMAYCVDAMKNAEREENVNIYAAALTLKVFYAIKATDCWGDIPYSEAFRLAEGVDYIYPKYDQQKDVYIQILAELKEAADKFDEQGPQLGVGDFLYKGDILKWKKFCNSLRLRAAIRACSGEVAVGQPTLVEVMGNPSKYPIILTNDANAYWQWPGNGVDEYWAASMASRNDDGYRGDTGWRARQSFIDALQNNNDPRMATYFELNSKGVYAGWISGPDQKGGEDNNPINTSAFGDRFAGVAGVRGAFVPFFNAAETYFNQAEAYLKGYVAGGDAKAEEAYVNGINLSCEENSYKASGAGTDNEITQEMIDAFLNEPGVKWNGNATPNADKIALQKWICMIKQSTEAWTEVRRTDVPKLLDVDIIYMLTHNRPPLRMPYSENEKNLNPNFPKDDPVRDLFWGQQLWWDKRTGVH